MVVCAPPRMRTLLAKRLFKHQALAIDAAMSGQHVALSTATSSGKSVVFNVSVVEAIVGARPEAVAMYLFPTKALAQDQLRSALYCTPRFVFLVSLQACDVYNQLNGLL